LGVAIAFCAVAACFIRAQIWPIQQAKRWDACLGKSIDSCRVPSDWGLDKTGCPDWIECHTDPPGVRYALAQMLKANRGEITDSYAYAVIALDAQDRVLKVEIGRFYPSL
jgi:hypothetical protein